MNTVQRSNRFIRTFRRVILRTPEKKYFVSGDRACRELVARARCRRRRTPDVEECSILAWARYELTRETLTGFWDGKAEYRDFTPATV